MDDPDYDENEESEKAVRALVKQVRAKDGVLTVPMTRVKQIYGGPRLKVHVRARITDSLRAAGLEFIGELPASETEFVRFFFMDMPAGLILEAVREPGAQGDERLRQAASTKRMKDQLVGPAILRKLRSIIDEFEDEAEDD